MDLKLAGKTALVTGSSSGIGVGIATALACEGAAVAVHGRNAQRAERVAEEIRAKGAHAVVVLGDLSSDVEADQVAEAALRQLGHVDILVNNAGRGNARGDVPWLEVTEKEFIDLHNDNVMSAVRMIRRLVPAMKQRAWGRVIVISSAGAVQPLPNIPDYCSSKAALVNLAVGLSKSVAGSGVTVNAVSPGLIMTPFLLTWMRALAQRLGWEGDDDTIEKRCCTELFNLAVDRVGKIEEVGDLVSFLASSRADFITGANFRIDGGLAKSVN